MSKETLTNLVILAWLLALAWPSQAAAQVPVDDNGTPVAATSAGEGEIPLLSIADLEALVGPIALYPDDLLAIVLPASTYPLQLVQADRFLQDLEVDSELKPDESWDDSIVALLNYPEAIELMTKDLDKTWRLGEAVVAQQADVVAAIESFRDQAYAAGNLQSDSRQTVAQNDGVIEITPVEDDVIYVPYYEPEEVVVYQPRPVYYYYPRAYPVYYYPYPYGYSFSRGFFWGVTTAFTVGWLSDSLHVYHHSYYGHPYYGQYYGYNYWYRRPSIHVHNNYYYNNNYVYNRHGHGDYWRPHSGSTVNHHDQRVTRSRHYPGSSSRKNSSRSTQQLRSNSSQRLSANSTQETRPVKFRQRTSTTTNQSSSIRPTQSRTAKDRTNSKQYAQIEFKERNGSPSRSRQASRADRPNANAQTNPRQPVRSGESRSSESRSNDFRSKEGRSSEPRQAARASQPRVSSPNKSREAARTNQPRVSSQGKPKQTARLSQPRVKQQSQPRQSGRSSAPKQQKARISSPNKAANRSNNHSANKSANKSARAEGNSRNRGNTNRRR